MADGKLTRLTQNARGAIISKHEDFVASRKGGVRANLSYHDLSGLSLMARNMSDANFTGAILSGPNLSNARLSGAVAINSNFSDSTMKSAKSRTRL